MMIKAGLSALLLIGLFVFAVQNRTMSDLRFVVWDFRTSLSAVVLYCAAAGAALVAVLAVPKLVRWYLRVRRLDREVCRLREACESGPTAERAETTESRS